MVNKIMVKQTMVKKTMVTQTMVKKNFGKQKLWSKARCSVIVFPIFEIVSQALHA